MRLLMRDPTNVSLVIIDENPDSLELLSTGLVERGVEIYTDTGPEQGLDLIYRKHPQIVLTGKTCKMSIMGRTSSFDPAVDVVGMTPHRSAEAAVEAIRNLTCDWHR